MTERNISQELELDVDTCLNTFGSSPCTAGRRFGPTVDFDFEGTAPSLVGINGTGSGTITFTRSGATATCFNSSGTLETLAANVARFDYDVVTLAIKGLLIEETRTNSIRNNAATGAVAGTPGTLPTNWGIGGNGGLSSQVVGVGVENGIDYLDLRYFGTVANVGFPEMVLVFESNTQIVAASGEKWWSTFYARVVAGTLTGVTGFENFVIGATNLGVVTESSTNTITVPTTGNLRSTRSATSRTLNNGTTARVYNRFDVNLTALASVDITIRIGMPQLEKATPGGNYSSVIRTTSAAVTRNLDRPTRVPGAEFSATEGSLFVEWQANDDPAGVAARIIYLGDGTDNERILLYVDHGSDTVNLLIVDGGVTQANLNLGAHLPGQVNRVAIAWKLNDIAGSLNGAAVLTDATATLPNITQIDYGHQNGSNFLNGWLRRVAHYNTRIVNANLVTLSGQGLIDFPNACYNTFRTCVDKEHYIKGTKTIRFTGIGSPVNSSQPARPYITRLDRAVTKIDPEEGLAPRASTNITMTDSPDSDVEMDPYITFRTSVAGSTFWRRFFARNLNYQGRPARIVKRFIDNGVFGAPVSTEKFLIDNVSGPNTNGDVRVVLKDPGKLLDKTKVPIPSSGKLALDIDNNSLVIPLTDASEYDPAGGWVRIEDEVIRYSSIIADDLILLNSTYRANFDTDPVAHKAGQLVQQCLVFDHMSVSDVLHTLYNLSGVPDSDMDLAGLALEDEVWLGEAYLVTTAITSPEAVDKLAKDLLIQCQMMAWWSTLEQKHKFKVYAPSSPGVLGTALNDDTLLDKMIEVERQDDRRITLAGVYYGLRKATLNVTEQKNYGIGELAIDLDAESPEEYDDRITKMVYSRWFKSNNAAAMRALAQRLVGRYRDAPEDIKKFSLDPADANLVEGELRDITTSGIVNASGVNKTVRVLVTSRKDMGTHTEYSGRITTFDRRYGFIAPDGTPNYPNNLGYACVSDAAGIMNDGSPGYLII